MKGEIMSENQQIIEEIRSFTRFFTVKMGIINPKYLNTEFSITEIRVLYELYEREDETAIHLSELLNIDKSYMSRILKKFEKNNLVLKKTSKVDKRLQILNLTPKGEIIVDDLINRTNFQISEMLRYISLEQSQIISSAMRTIIENFD